MDVSVSIRVVRPIGRLLPDIDGLSQTFVTILINEEVYMPVITFRCY